MSSSFSVTPVAIVPKKQVRVMPNSVAAQAVRKTSRVKLLSQPIIVIDESGSSLNGSPITTENLVNDALVVFEVVPELALLHARGPNDLVRILCSKSLFEKELCCGADHLSLDFNCR
jgi:hypothetical protein